MFGSLLVQKTRKMLALVWLIDKGWRPMIDTKEAKILPFVMWFGWCKKFKQKTLTQDRVRYGLFSKFSKSHERFWRLRRWSLRLHVLLYQDNLPLDCIQLSVQGPGVTIMLMTEDHALNNDINERGGREKSLVWPEAGPISRTTAPAHGHQLVDRLRSVLRAL